MTSELIVLCRGSIQCKDQSKITQINFSLANEGFQFNDIPGEKMGKNYSPKISYNVYETDCYFENK